jgi:hypothetical protein
MVAASLTVESASSTDTNYGGFGWIRSSTSCDYLGVGARPGVYVLKTYGTTATNTTQFDCALFEAGDTTLTYFDGSYDGVNAVTGTTGISVITTNTSQLVTQNSIWESTGKSSQTAELSRSHYYYNYYNNKNKLAFLLADEVYMGNATGYANDYSIYWDSASSTPVGSPSYIPSTITTSSTITLKSAFSPTIANASVTKADKSDFGKIGADSYYKINDYAVANIARLKASYSPGSTTGTANQYLYTGDGAYTYPNRQVTLLYIMSSADMKAYKFKKGDLIVASGIFGGTIDWPNAYGGNATEILSYNYVSNVVTVNTGAVLGTLLPRVHGKITGATNNVSSVITCNNHGLKNGDTVYIAGSWAGAFTSDSPKTVSAVATNTFTLTYASAPGAYSGSDNYWYINTLRNTGETWTITRKPQTLVSSEWPYMYDIKYATSLTGTGGLDKYYYGKYLPSTTTGADTVTDYQTPIKAL